MQVQTEAAIEEFGPMIEYLRCERERMLETVQMFNESIDKLNND